MTEFDELKKIWNTQNEEVMYAINEETLYKKVSKKNTHLLKMIDHYEVITIICMGLAGIITMADSIIDQEEKYTWIAPIVMFSIAAYVGVTRMKRKKVNDQTDTSLLGIIDNAITMIDYQLARLKQTIWWMILPFTSIYLLSMYNTFYGRPIWVWLLLPVWLFIMFFGLRWEINKRYTPKKRELKKLRELLIN